MTSRSKIERIANLGTHDLQCRPQLATCAEEVGDFSQRNSQRMTTCDGLRYCPTGLIMRKVIARAGSKITSIVVRLDWNI